MIEVKNTAFKPPSQEYIFKNYFKEPQDVSENRTENSILNTSTTHNRMEESMKENLKKNISDLEKEMKGSNISRIGVVEAVQDYVRTSAYKNFLPAPVEPTTFKYPTAIWSSHNYEKLKNRQKIHLEPTPNRAWPYQGIGYFRISNNNVTREKGQRKNRGRTKWRDLTQNEQHPDNLFQTIKTKNNQKSDFADRFLQQSLAKYIASSNLKETVGNVSVKTFSEILKNITDEKPRKLLSPYDENKELRMKFRNEVVLRQKNETKPQGKFLEKQLQKRLEKVQDVFHEKDRDKIIANMWKYSTLNRTVDLSEEKRNKNNEDFLKNYSISSEIPEYNSDEHNKYTTNINSGKKSKNSKSPFRGTVKFNSAKYFADNDDDDDENWNKRKTTGKIGNNKNLLKLTAEESSYYRKEQFPSLTFIGRSGK